MELWSESERKQRAIVYMEHEDPDWFGVSVRVISGMVTGSSALRGVA
jgi:hypothetical protein